MYSLSLSPSLEVLADNLRFASFSGITNFFWKEWEFNRSENRVRKEEDVEEEGEGEMRGPCGLSKMFLNAGGHMLHFWF